MKERRLRRRADHLPAGVEVDESFDDRGKKHISIVATQGAANLRDIASLRPQDLKLGRVFASSDDIRFVTNIWIKAESQQTWQGSSCDVDMLLAATSNYQTLVPRSVKPALASLIMHKCSDHVISVRWLNLHSLMIPRLCRPSWT